MVKPKKTNPEKLTAIAVEIIKNHGFENLSVQILCESAGIARGSFKHYAGVWFAPFKEALREQHGHEKSHELFTRRLLPEDRKSHLVRCAHELSTVIGVSNITRANLSEHARVSRTTTQNYYRDLSDLRHDVLNYAISDAVFYQQHEKNDSEFSALVREYKNDSVSE